MSVFRKILCLVIWLCFLPINANALDYQPTWDFSVPVGAQEPALGTDSLTYHLTTGDLVYRSGDAERWSPPDVGSISGILLDTLPLEPDPIWGMPIFTADEEFGGSVVPGSNAIRTHADNWVFWPWSPNDPFILQHFGLESLPRVYNYGSVLPKGLTKEFLSNDLYAISFPNQPLVLRVVPEPSWIAILVVGLLSLGTYRATQLAIAKWF